MNSTSDTCLLVPDETIAVALRDALSARFQAVSGEIHVEIASGSIAHAIETARARRGGAPLGFVALDEASALEALRVGADEAMAWPPGGEQAIQGFLDRTLLRAKIRREQEVMRATVVHKEKLAALGTLVAGVAHEINNPLTVLQLTMEGCRALLYPSMKVTEELGKLVARGAGATPEQIARLNTLARTGAPNSEGSQLFEEMLIASKAIADIVRDLRIFARSDERSEGKQIVEVADLIDQVLRLVGREFPSQVIVERDYAPGLPKLVIPPGRLSQVLINILMNAAHAVREIERTAHRVRISTRTDDQHVAITVSDTGPGIAPETLDHIFDPFFTTKRVGTGTGLGLSISRSIMMDMGGDLIVTSVHGDGATFIALVPLPDETALRAAATAAVINRGSLSSRERPSVLFVDEDNQILRAYSRALGRDCNVLLAEDGQEAIELLSSGSSPDAIVTELSLPQIDGAALYSWLRRERPGLVSRTVFVTAHSTTLEYKSFLRDVHNPVLLKPVNAPTLKAAIDDVISESESKTPISRVVGVSES
ncbi:MAG TPA: ATP-binding protein [Polyangiaceae bacterium]|nr:ATP-binding protein [Polyangiaceae bacterium]